MTADRRDTATPRAHPSSRPDLEPSDPPVITAITPDTCVMGDPDFTLYVSGTGFHATSVIFFDGYDEPTTLNEDGTLSIGVKPSLWYSPVTVQCQVRNGEVLSDAVDFSFIAPVEPSPSKPSDPAEAAKWLAKLGQQIEHHLVEYKREPDGTVVSYELAQWFVAAVKKGGSLELALGLRRGKGKPKQIGPGKHFDVARQVFVLRELQGKSWKAVCDELNFPDQRELQKIYKRELPKVLRAYAGEIALRLKRRGVK